MKVIVIVVLIGAICGWWLTRARTIQSVRTPRVIRGMTLPHHELAGELIDTAVSRLAKQREVKRIILFSPNHFRPLSSLFTTTYLLAGLPIDREGVDYVVKRVPLTIVDEELLAGEHGLKVPGAHLALKFPNAVMVPIAVSPYFTPEALDKMAEALTTKFGEDTIYITSVDFAHDKMMEEGLGNNTESIGAIEGFDYQKIYSFGDEHMDTRAGVALLMKIMEKVGAKQWETWTSSHGAIITGRPTLQSTSYVIGVFR